MTTKTNMTLETLFARTFARTVRATLQLFLLLSLFPFLVPAAQATTLQTHSYTYDTLGRMVTDTDANSQTTSYTYDQNGNRLSATDPLGRVTSYSYDALDRLVSVTNPLSGVTSYVYDPLDHLVTVTDPLGHSTSYTYNGLDQLLSQSSPDTGSTSFTYGDGANVVTQRTNAASQNTQITYDALNRPSTITYADGRVVTYGYDQGTNGAGRLTSVSDKDSSLSWTWDSYGRPLSRTQLMAASGQSYVISYAWDQGSNASGHLSSLTYPSGLIVSYTYDSQGRIASISQNGNTVLSGITYRPLAGSGISAIAGWTWANGTTHQVSYDQNGNPSTMSVGNDSLVFSYDNVQRLISSEYVSNSATQTYSYDTLDRLYTYTGLGSTHAWTYDANGNRLSHSAGSATDTYVLASLSNRLSTLTPAGQGTHNYTYNANGQTLSDGTNTYSYDARERLVSVSNSAGSTAYLLNPLGQRIAKSPASGATLNYLYDDAGQLLSETNSSGAIADEYLYLGGVPVAVAVGSSASGSDGIVLSPLTSTNPLWNVVSGSPLPTEPTSTTNPSGIRYTAPSDPYSQITWDTSQSVCSNACFAINDFPNGSSSYIYPTLLGNTVYAGRSTRFHFEFTTAADPGNTRHIEFGILNGGSQTAGLLRQQTVMVLGNTAEIQYVDGSSLASNGSTNFSYAPLSFTVQNNQTYVVEVDATPTGSTAYLFPKGSTRAQGVSQSISTDWTVGGTSNLGPRAYASGYSWAGTSGSANVNYLTNVTISALGGRALYNIHPDQLGTPRQITTSDSSNSLVWRWDSEPFGTAAPNQDPMSTGAPFVFNLRFPGQYYDAESGLNYNVNRNYNSGSGRYNESDPIGLDGGLNTYAYVNGNPANRIDPRGLLSAQAHADVNAALARNGGNTGGAESDLLNQREKNPYDQDLANAEHYMFARDWTYQTYGLGAFSLLPGVPIYEMCKAAAHSIGAQGPHKWWDGSNPSWGSIGAGYQGMAAGLLEGGK